MTRNKTPAKSRQSREEGISMARASAKNRRLAEQMSRRPGGKAMMDQINKESVKDRIDRSKVHSDVRDRLGNFKRGSSVQNRLGRGASTRMGNTFGNNTRGSRGNRGGTRGRGGGSFTTRGRGRPSNASLTFRGSRGRPRGRPRGSGRGRGRGRGREKEAPNRDNLDNELDSYMSATKS